MSSEDEPQETARGRINRLLPRTIRGRLILLLLVVLVPNLLVEVAMYSTRFSERRAQELQSNLEIARAASSAFDSYIRDVLHHELTIGAVFTSPEPLSLGQATRLLEVHAGDYPAIRNYSWVSPEGRTIASSGPDLLGMEIGDRPYFQEIVQGREWVISDLLVGRHGGTPTFTVARGIRDEKGVLQGVIVAAIDPLRLDEVLTFQRTSKEGSIVIFDSNGALVYRHPQSDLTTEQRNEMTRVLLLDQTPAGEESTGTIELPFDKRSRMAARTPIRSIGWVAAASRPAREVMNSVADDLLHETGLYLLFAGIAFLIALVLSRSITVPLQRLREDALALGHGELHRRVEVKGPAELEKLAGAFNRMADELRVREANREEYIHTISHDLRNPLTIIQGQGQMLVKFLEKAGLGPRERHSAEAVITSARRMNAMIQDLVDSARLEAGQLRLDKETGDLRSFLSELLEEATGIMDVGRVRLEMAESLPRFAFDPDRLERILMNLLSNALKYSRAGTEVLIKAEKLDEEVVVSVADKGVGIEPEELAHIFERFYRAKSGRESGGLGLGLYITKMLVEAHGGRIWVESEMEKGSTFCFTLLLEGPVAKGEDG